MLFKFLGTFAFLVVTVFSTENESCSPKNVSNPIDEAKMISGNFSGQLPTPGFLKLEIQKDGKALFLNVVTIHLPPAEIERLESKITEKGGRICLENSPKTIEPCFVSASDKEIVVKMSSDGKEISLKKVKENN